MIASHNIDKNQAGQRPKWSLRAAFWVFVWIVLLSTAGVLLLSHKDLWLELEMVVSIVALALFLFYWWVLYHAVHFYDDDQLTLSFIQGDVADPGWPDGGFGLASGADDPIGCIIAILLEVVLYLLVAFVLSFLVWIGINGLLLCVTLIAMPVFFIFRSSVRFVLRNAPACHRNLLKSAGLAAGFALLKTCWFFAVIAGSHYLALWYKVG
jgi:hypothetical protein